MLKVATGEGLFYWGQPADKAVAQTEPWHSSWRFPWRSVWSLDGWWDFDALSAGDGTLSQVRVPGSPCSLIPRGRGDGKDKVR